MKVIELDYVIHPQFHGPGYVTEALRAVIKYLFVKDTERLLQVHLRIMSPVLK